MMRLLLLAIISCAQLFASYGYQRSITIDHTKVPNTDQSYFPVLISGTYSYLATVANSGLVQHTDVNGNATDLVFTSDSGCSILLPFEIESYTASTGAIIYWVRVPLVSHTSDTVIYMCYGNAAVTTQQAQPRAVWANGFTMVMHLAGNNTDSMADGYWMDHTGTDTSITYNTSNGQIGQGAGFNGTTSKYRNSTTMGTNTGLTTNVTLSAWVKWTGGTTESLPLSNGGNISGDAKGYGFLIGGTGGYGCGLTSGKIYLVLAAISCNPLTGGYQLVNGTWAYISVTRGASTWTLYANGISQATGTTNPISPSTVVNLGSNSSAEFFGGALDEVRMAKMPRSADWLLTEYNNQSSPSTFYTVAGSAATPAPYAFTNNRAVTLDHSKVPNTDQVNFPILFSGTYAYLATVGNGGQVQNANGYDIAFATDSSCKNGYLAFEMDGYTAATGLVNFWVNIPLLSHTVDTVIYLCYGSSAVSASLENKGLTWNSHYKAVWHHPDGSSLTLGDSTIYGTTGTNHGATATTGQIDGAAALAQASTQYIDEGNLYPVNLSQCDSGVACTFNYSFEAWVDFTGTYTNGVNPYIISEQNAAQTRGVNMFMSAKDNGAANNTIWCQENNGGLVSAHAGAGALTQNVWHHLMCTMGTTLNACIDATCATGAGGLRDDGQTGINVGRWGATPANTYWDGKIDEVRIADVDWSSDRITALYNTERNAFMTASSPGPASTGARGFAYVQ